MYCNGQGGVVHSRCKIGQLRCEGCVNKGDDQGVLGTIDGCGGGNVDHVGFPRHKSGKMGRGVFVFIGMPDKWQTRNNKGQVVHLWDREAWQA